VPDHDQELHPKLHHVPRVAPAPTTDTDKDPHGIANPYRHN